MARNVRLRPFEVRPIPRRSAAVYRQARRPSRPIAAGCTWHRPSPRHPRLPGRRANYLGAGTGGKSSSPDRPNGPRRRDRMAHRRPSALTRAHSRGPRDLILLTLAYRMSVSFGRITQNSLPSRHAGLHLANPHSSDADRVAVERATSRVAVSVVSGGWTRFAGHRYVCSSGGRHS